MPTTTILDDGRRLVVDEDGWKASRNRLNTEFVKAMDNLRGQWLKQSLAVSEAAIKTPDFMANGLDSKAKGELKATQAELERQYKAAVLQLVEAFYEAQGEQCDTFIQRQPALPVLGQASNLPALPM